MSTLIERLKPILEQYEEIRFAYLFGSRARGYERLYSDVDLAIFFAEGASAWTEVSVEEELTRQMRLPVQVIPLGRKLPAHLTRSILETGLLLKDGEGRQQWEASSIQAIQEDEMNRERGEEDYRRYLLDSVEEKARLILKALPLLSKLDLEQVKQDEPEAVQDFLGAFLMISEPLETIVRRMAVYARLALGHEGEPTTLRDQMAVTASILDLDDEALERFGWLARLRNRIAHAYWHLAEEELTRQDLEETRALLKRFIEKLGAFIIMERGRWP